MRWKTGYENAKKFLYFCGEFHLFLAHNVTKKWTPCQICFKSVDHKCRKAFLQKNLLPRPLFKNKWTATIFLPFFKNLWSSLINLLAQYLHPLICSSLVAFLVLRLISHGILHYLLSADLLIDLLMFFSTDFSNIYLFSTSFSIDRKL